MLQILSQGRADLGLYQVVLQSYRRYGVDCDECDEHDDGGQCQYQIQRRRREGRHYCRRQKEGEDLGGGGRVRNDEYDNDKDNNE